MPFTRGDERTGLDAALYLAVSASLVVALVLPGHTHGIPRVAPPPSIIPVIVGLVVLGLRDKVFFLAARGEQYVPALIFFAFFPFVDMIVAAKLLIVIVWCGAAFSKFGRHFANVIPPMVSNTPWLTVKRIKRLHYRSFPEDLRPSERAVGLAHIGGTLVEFVTPLVLLFSHNHTVTVAAVVLMLGFHAFIISTFPLAVPLEWNALFMYIAAFLFLGYPTQSGYGLENMDPISADPDRRRTAVLPCARQPPSGPRVVSPLDATVRRQLGNRPMGAGSRCRGKARHEHRQGSEDAKASTHRHLW